MGICGGFSIKNLLFFLIKKSFKNDLKKVRAHDNYLARFFQSFSFVFWGPFYAKCARLWSDVNTVCVLLASSVQQHASPQAAATANAVPDIFHRTSSSCVRTAATPSNAVTAKAANISLRTNVRLIMIVISIIDSPKRTAPRPKPGGGGWHSCLTSLEKASSTMHSS